jgi:prophage antirepressor-like protein
VSARKFLEVRTMVAGHAVRATQADDGAWLTAQQVADFIGYTHARSVMELYRNHAEELREFVRSPGLPVTGPKRVTCFSPRSLVHFAMLAKTPKAVAFRRSISALVSAGAARRGKVGCADLLTEAQDILCEAFARLEPLRDATPKNSEERDVLSDSLKAIDEHLALIDVQRKGIQEIAAAMPKTRPARDGWLALGEALGGAR